MARPRVPARSCLILDIVPPDLSGLELQKLVAGRVETPVILLSRHGDVPMIVQAMKAGAFDFFTKPADPQALMDAIEHAAGSQQGRPSSRGGLQALRDRYETLSPREREVMTLVVSGLLNKEAGGELGISEITVKQHRGRVMRKMGAKSLPDLVRMAANLRLSVVCDRRPPPARPQFIADRAGTTVPMKWRQPSMYRIDVRWAHRPSPSEGLSLVTQKPRQTIAMTPSKASPPTRRQQPSILRRLNELPTV